MGNEERGCEGGEDVDIEVVEVKAEPRVGKEGGTNADVEIDVNVKAEANVEVKREERRGAGDDL